MLKSKVRSEFGLGIPINFSKLGEAEPDFGASATCLFILWYSLNNSVGDATWLGYCKAEWNPLLDYCLNSYDKKETYLLPHSENNTKILFLPRFNLDETRSKRIEEYVIQLKRAISVEMKQHKGKLHKLLSEVPSPQGLEHVKEIITTWQITKYWSDQRRWAFDAWSEIGQVLGGYTIGALRALSSIS